MRLMLNLFNMRQDKRDDFVRALIYYIETFEFDKFADLFDDSDDQQIAEAAKAAKKKVDAKTPDDLKK